MLGKKQVLISALAVLIIAVLMIPCSYAETNTLYTEEITISYDMGRCEIRYWHTDAEVRHTLVLSAIQELQEYHIRRSLYLTEAKVDTFRVTEEYQGLTYFVDDYMNDNRANVYISVSIIFNEIYLHFTIGTWDVMTEGNFQRLAYSLDGLETKYIEFNNGECSMNIIVSETETSQSSSATSMANVWEFLDRFQVILTIVVLLLTAVILTYSIAKRKFNR